MILVTGGTGLVGRHLLLALTESESTEIRATFRSTDSVEGVNDFFAFAKAEKRFTRIRWFQTDITDIPSLTEAFKGVTHVYHCAALISFDPYDFKKLTKVNIEGTANVVNLCLSHKIKKLCHLSSIATLSSLPYNPVNEENFWDANEKNSVYALSKYGAEMEVWRGTEEGLEAIIFNPSIILGEGDYTSGSGEIFTRIYNGLSYIPTGGSGVIDVKDLVTLLILGMQSAIHQERFIASSYNRTYDELIVLISKELNRKSSGRRLSNSILKIYAAWDAFLGVFLRRRKVTSAQVESLSSVKKYDTSKVTSAFDLRPTDLKVTIERIATHFLNQV